MSTTSCAALVLACLIGTAGCGGSSGGTESSTSHSGHRLTVTSSLAGVSRLPLRIHWVAHPSDPPIQVSEVDYLIDGKLAWVEQNSPYYYGDDGNWLVTSFLTPGPHTLTVKVKTIDGHTASEAVHAMATAPPSPPGDLAGTWHRTVTPADVKKATSDQPPPPGRWGLIVTAHGWGLRDPHNGGGEFDVAYTSRNVVQMRPTIEHPPFPNPDNGGFCQDTDPLALWTATVGDGGKTLTLHPKGHDPCGDRAAILQGTWLRH
jgi:hypothetical protein